MTVPSRLPILTAAGLIGGLAAAAARAEAPPAQTPAPPAPAQASPYATEKKHMLEEAFDSTIVSTYPDGRTAELWLKRDGTYEAEGRRHEHTFGVWQVNGYKLCLKQRRPFTAPFSYCTDVPKEGLDTPWTGKAFTGEPIHIRRVDGHYDPAIRQAGEGVESGRPEGEAKNGE
jgi:hypothetical protein